MAESKMTLMKVSQIKTAARFQLFPIHEDVLKRIQASIERDGFDQNQALSVWEEKGVLVDGHTRLEAAKRAKILDAPVVLRSFADEDDALAFAIRAQVNRRNLTEADILELVTRLDKRKKAGRPNLLASFDANIPKGKSSEETAKTLQTSPAKIERARYLLAHGSEDSIQAVRDNKMTIHAAAKKAHTNLIQDKIILRRIPINGGKDFAIEFSRENLLRALNKVLVMGWSPTDYKADTLVFQKEWVGTYKHEYDTAVFYPLETGLEGAIPVAPLMKMLKIANKDLVQIRCTGNQFILEASDHRNRKGTLKLNFLQDKTSKRLADIPIGQIKWKPLPKDFLTGLRYCANSVTEAYHEHHLRNIVRKENNIFFDGIDIFSKDKNRVSWFILSKSMGSFSLPIIKAKALTKLPGLVSYGLTDGWANFKNKDGIIFGVATGPGPSRDFLNQMKGDFAGPWLRTHDYPKEIGSPFTKMGIDKYSRILLRGKDILHMVNPQQRVVYKDEKEKTGLIRGKWFAPIDNFKDEDDKDTLFYNYGVLHDRGFLTFYFPTEKEAGTPQISILDKIVALLKANRPKSPRPSPV